MREPLDDPRPGEKVASSLAFRADDDVIRPGARVETTDGILDGPGLIRETQGYTVVLA